jgi:LPXTG-motif cell wall-anchored protein
VTRFRLPLRRFLAVAAGLLVGASGALAIAGPAAATDTDPYSVTVEGSAACAPQGVWKIDWKVTNDAAVKARIVFVGDDRPPYEEGKTVGDIHSGVDLAAGASVSGVEETEASLASAKLVVTVHYSVDGQVLTRQSFDEVPLASQSTCAPTCVTASTAKYQHTFNAQSGKATVQLKGDLPMCKGESQAFSLASYFATAGTFAYPQYLHDSDTKAIDDAHNKVRLDVSTPHCYRQLDLVFGSEVYKELTEGGKLYGDRKLGSPNAPGSNSEGPQAWFNGGKKECTQPVAEFVSNCDGSVTVTLTNTSSVPSTAVFTISGVEGTVSVKSGEKPVEVTVPASAAGDIKVTEKNKKKTVGTYKWERPDGCAAPTAEFASSCDALLGKLINPKGNAPVEATVVQGESTAKVTLAGGKTEPYEFDKTRGAVKVTFADFDKTFTGTYTQPTGCEAAGGGGDLPRTGSRTSVMAGGGAALLAAGGFLFFLVRRRRIRFTAA